MTKVQHTQDIISSIRTQTNRAVMFYSVNGKDSIALLDMLAKSFDEVICYYMYFVKDLEHIERYVRLAEKMYPNIIIRQLPHFMLSNIRRAGVFCTPIPDTKIQKIKDIEKIIRQETGERFIFSGMKGVDGFMKRMRLKMWGENFTTESGEIYPLALWTNNEVLRYIKTHQLPTPVNYTTSEHQLLTKNGRVMQKVSSGLTFDIDVFLWLRKFYPQDLEAIYTEFPLSKQIIFEYEYQKQNQPSGE